MLEPIGMMLMTPSRMMCFPPIAIMPMMMFIPIAIQRPFRMMCSNPIRVMLEPPAAMTPFMMLVVVTPARMVLVGMRQSGYA